MGKLSRELKMGIHNRFDIEVVDVKTGEVKQKAQAFNVVCNGYFSAINTTTYSNIQIGKGSGTPSANDTALFSYIGYGSTASTYSPFDIIEQVNEAEGIWCRRIKRTIPNTSYVGETITEVGFGASSGTIVTHAMLQDMNGNPISIEHTSTDIINLYCTIYLHYEGQDSDMHLYHWVETNDRSFIVCAALLSNTFSQNYCNMFYSNDTPKFGDSQAVQSVSKSNRSITIKATQVAISVANIDGIGCVAFGRLIYRGGYLYTKRLCVDFSLEVGKETRPPYQITDESVAIGDGNTTKFKTKFRHPYNATIKINGQTVGSGVNVLNASLTSFSANTQPLEDIVLTNAFINKPTVPRYPIRMGRDSDTGYAATISAGGAIQLKENVVGLYRINAANGNIKGSNDGETWVDVATSTANSQMDQSGAHYKFYKNTGSSDASIYMNAYDGYNIIFDTPPAQGDVITIDYTTDYIPKDSDHVLDVELTFTFGEWTGE